MFLKQNNIITVIKDTEVDIKDKLPLGTYLLKESRDNFYLEEIENFKIENKLYGNIKKNTDKIINTFFLRNKSTGILLSGLKGTGKTLLAKNISINLLAKNISTIIINDCFYGDEFNIFLQNIKEPTLILFEEFDKNYQKAKSDDEIEPQEKLLTLLDGTFNSNKLFIFTTNYRNNIDKCLLGRPSRIYYDLDFDGLNEEEIIEFAEDNLKDKENLNLILSITRCMGKVSFDIIQTIVEEVNNYPNSTIEDFINYLNLDIDNSNRYYSLEKIYEGKNIFKKEIRINPFIENELEFYNEKDENEIIPMKDFIYDKDKNTFTKKGKNEVIILKPTKEEDYNQLVKRFL